MTFPDFFRRKGTRRKNGINYALTEYDSNDLFVIKKCSRYVLLYFSKYGFSNSEALEFLSWILGDLRYEFIEGIVSLVGGGDQKKKDNYPPESILDHTDFSQISQEMVSKLTQRSQKILLQNLWKTLEKRGLKTGNQGISEFEKTAINLKKLFDLSDFEIELCLFLFIIKSYDPPENFFSYYLESERFSGRKYLCTALGITRIQLNEILSGTLYKVGIIEVDKHEICLSDEFLCLFQNPSTEIFSDKFYQKAAIETVPLDHHFMPADQTNHLLRLLKNKSQTATHILLYGEPGTGKTSYAYGLVSELGSEAYEVAYDTDNKTKNRRAAIRAALNMTNTGSGSVVIVDEADNILNTQNSWFDRGETQDKGYLNQLMEEAGARIIWICNNIQNIDPSILRRFAFSIQFKPFTRSQRVKLFENIIRENRVKRFFSDVDIAKLAKDYDVNAGTIDISLKKAIESGVGAKTDFKEAFTMGLGAYQSMIKGSQSTRQEDIIEKNYSLEGLNISCDIYSEIQILEKFDDCLRNCRHQSIRNMNLLFYGPPGTGKSEFARYIANRLERECICKRLSDILSPFVGLAEKNIRGAFDEAEREEAVLVIDEADSLIFSRAKAIRSWEASQTNEFLTAMEKYKGILICTTNMIKQIDNASMRRFSRKIKFDYLEPEGNIIFYKKFLEPLVNQSIDKDALERLKRIKFLTPGDFKVVRDKYLFFDKIDHRNLIEAIGEEVNIKVINHNKNRIGF